MQPAVRKKAAAEKSRGTDQVRAGIRYPFRIEMCFCDPIENTLKPNIRSV